MSKINIFKWFSPKHSLPLNNGKVYSQHVDVLVKKNLFTIILLQDEETKKQLASFMIGMKSKFLLIACLYFAQARDFKRIQRELESFVRCVKYVFAYVKFSHTLLIYEK